MKFYCNLFQTQRENHDEVTNQDLEDITIASISMAKNLLEALIDDQEVKEIVFAMEPTKTAGPNGFSAILTNSIGIS